MMAQLGMDEDMPIESGWSPRRIEKAQTKVEGHNFDIRKHVVEYDDVMNKQRDVIYTERTRSSKAPMRENIFGMVEEEIEDLVAATCPARRRRLGPRDAVDDVRSMLPARPNAGGDPGDQLAEEIEACSLDEAEAALRRQRGAEVGADACACSSGSSCSRRSTASGSSTSRRWMRCARASACAAYGQQDPLVAYKREAHDMWDQLLENIRHTVARAIYHVGLAQAPRPPQPFARPRRRRGDAVAASAGGQPVQAGPSGLRENRPDQAAAPAAKANGKKIGRNDPCYCGSGKKYKRCHGAGCRKTGRRLIDSALTRGEGGRQAPRIGGRAPAEGRALLGRRARRVLPRSFSQAPSVAARAMRSAAVGRTTSPRFEPAIDHHRRNLQRRRDHRLPSPANRRRRALVYRPAQVDGPLEPPPKKRSMAASTAT